MAESRQKSTTSTKSTMGKVTRGSRAASNTTVKLDVLDTQGKVVDTLTVPSEMFDAPDNPTLVAQAVRVYQFNQRQGTLSTKSRGDINASTKKVWRQKGTGRARHGAKSAPIFVGGGVAFGPKPRDFSLKLPQKMKQKALFSVLTTKRKENALKIISGMGTMDAKTKQAVAVFSSLSLTPAEKNVLFITDGKTDSVYKAVRNIHGVEVISASLLNTYAVLKGSTIVFTKEGMESFLNRQTKKN